MPIKARTGYRVGPTVRTVILASRVRGEIRVTRTRPQTMPSGEIVRGPMATDNYTQLHNLAFRGAIDTRYVGVFGFIASHREGWSLTAASVAKALNVGTYFVRHALAAIEAAGCLIRKRKRNPDGTLGGSVWFVTDLPLQLRQLGITDEAVIREQVQAAYNQWVDAPKSGNRTLAVTCENADPIERLPRSEPKCGYPTLVEPTLDNPPHKKNNPKKTKEKKNNPPLPPVPTQRQAPAPVEPREGRREEQPEDDTQRPDASGHRPAAEAIVDALPPVGRSRIGAKLRATLVTGIAAKLADGWQPGDVADELTHDLETARTTGVYAHRLAEMPTQPPRRRTPAAAPQTALKPPKCEDDECDHNRQRHTADGLPYRCPKCHPLAVGRPQRVADGSTAPLGGDGPDPRLTALLRAAAGSARI
jgi:hypothetical protein